MLIQTQTTIPLIISVCGQLFDIVPPMLSVCLVALLYVQVGRQLSPCCFLNEISSSSLKEIWGKNWDGIKTVKARVVLKSTHVIRKWVRWRWVDCRWWEVTNQNKKQLCLSGWVEAVWSEPEGGGRSRWHQCFLKKKLPRWTWLTPKRRKLLIMATLDRKWCINIDILSLNRKCTRELEDFLKRDFWQKREHNHLFRLWKWTCSCCDVITFSHSNRKIH